MYITPRQVNWKDNGLVLWEPLLGLGAFLMLLRTVLYSLNKVTTKLRNLLLQISNTMLQHHMLSSYKMATIRDFTNSIDPDEKVQDADAWQ